MSFWHRPPGTWPFLILIGLGVFAGTFWIFLGFLLVLGQPVSGWQYAITLLPGAGILFLVMMARRHPAPYGAALIALGLIPLALFRFSSAWQLRLEFGLPLVALGLGLVLLRKQAGSGTGEIPHG